MSHDVAKVDMLVNVVLSLVAMQDIQHPPNPT